MSKRQPVPAGPARAEKRGVRAGMGLSKIKHVRAFTVRGGGADYADQPGPHWIDDHIASPMAKYEGYRQSRQKFGLGVLGTLIVEIEAENGVTGFAVTTGAVRFSSAMSRIARSYAVDTVAPRPLTTFI